MKESPCEPHGHEECLWCNPPQREPRHEPRTIAGVPVDFCECTFHAVNGSDVGLVPTCKRHAGAI